VTEKKVMLVQQPDLKNLFQIIYGQKTFKLYLYSVLNLNVCFSPVEHKRRHFEECW